MLASVHGGAPGRNYDLIAIVASAGGLATLQTILRRLSEAAPAPIVILQHLPAQRPSFLVPLLQLCTRLPVVWATDGQNLAAKSVYIVPAGCRPVLARPTSLTFEPCGDSPPWTWGASRFLESVARAHGARGLGVVLTGAGTDGAEGAAALRAAGGTVLVQDPATCFSSGMPEAAIASKGADLFLTPRGIATAMEVLVAIPGAAQNLLGSRIHVA